MSDVRELSKNLLALVSIVLFALMVVVAVWQVFTRQVLNDPSTWSEELSRLFFVWLTFIGGAFLFGERGHIAVDFLARRLSPTGQVWAQAFAQLMVAAFAGVGMLWGGIVAAANAWNQNLTALPFTVGWIYVVIPVAGAFILFFALTDFIAVLRGRLEPYPDPDELEATVAKPTRPVDEGVLDGGKP